MSKKSFDCVQMKNDIQQKLAKEYNGLSPHEIEVRQRKKIISNPLLKKFAVEASLTKTHSGKNITACLCAR